MRDHPLGGTYGLREMCLQREHAPCNDGGLVFRPQYLDAIGGFQPTSLNAGLKLQLPVRLGDVMRSEGASGMTEVPRWQAAVDGSGIPEKNVSLVQNGH